ncbi:NifU family protein [Streptomyces sp.]|uniref:NifU family protein n=1 Tax=Streptomyces sp. TaxID=1931 RepID=UPI002F41BC56
MSWDDEHARRQVALAEDLLSGLDALPDGAAAARAAETVETLVGLYGECLARITARLAEHGHGDALRALADDELVGHLLLVHDLHPDPVETRVRDALAALPNSPEVLEVTTTAVRVRVAGGCGSGGAEQAVREALAARAPEIEDVRVDAGTEETLIPVDALFRNRARVGQGAG